MEKIGVVMSGGGNKCGAMIGMMRALKEVHGIEPYVLVTCSGSTGIAFFSLAGRYDDMYKWPHLFDDRRFVSLRRFWRIMDIDFLVDGILARQAPTLPQELAQIPTRVFVAVTDVGSGIPVWLTNGHLEDLWRIKKATCAVPGVYGKVVEVQGNTYVDGSFSASTDACIAKAFEEGATKVVVLDVGGKYVDFFGGLALRILSWRQGRAVRAIVRNFLRANNMEVLPRERVYVCRVPQLAIRNELDTKEAHTARGIEQGYEAMARMTL